MVTRQEEEDHCLLYSASPTIHLGSQSSFGARTKQSREMHHNQGRAGASAGSPLLCRAELGKLGAENNKKAVHVCTKRWLEGLARYMLTDPNESKVIPQVCEGQCSKE